MLKNEIGKITHYYATGCVLSALYFFIATVHNWYQYQWRVKLKVKSKFKTIHVSFPVVADKVIQTDLLD